MSRKSRPVLPQNVFEGLEGTNIIGPCVPFNVERNRGAAFMNARILPGIAIAFAASVIAGSPVLAVDPGRAAPPFDLPLMDGAGSAPSDEIFSKHEYTFIETSYYQYRYLGAGRAHYRQEIAEAPLIRHARLRGEIIVLNRTYTHGILTVEGPATALHE